MNRPDLPALCYMVVERSPLALAVTRGDAHRIDCANAAFGQVTGVAPADLADRPFAEAVTASRTDGSLALLDRVWETGQGEGMSEVEHQLPGGGRAIWSYAAWPVLDEQRRPAALIVQVSDVTERVRARRAEAETAGEARQAAQRLLVAGVKEQELAEEAEQHSAEMDALLKSMSDGVVVVDADHRIVLMNEAGRQIFQLPPEERIWAPAEQGDMRLEQLDGTPIPLEQWPVARALRGEHFDQYEAVLVHSDDAERRVLFSGSALRDDADHITLALVVFRDVTELRETEALKDQLIALIAHDLRSPLNAILANADLLRMRLAEEGREEEVGFTETIVRGVDTMNAMIGELFESTRLESQMPQVHKRPCYLRNLASDAVEHLVSPKHRPRIKALFPEQLLAVPCDPERLERVFMNLLGNALKYSPPDASVTVRLEQHGDEAVVSVTDQGVGISPEDLAHVFDRFYRAKSGAKAEGFGLGLYSARLIIEAHGGRIWAESKPGEGSTFSFALPLDEEDNQRHGDLSLRTTEDVP